MTAPNRVDDLRKRYHENPRRFFAPLANEYRKTGFIDRAILLCEKHLGEQPGNMNGLVVYGQCLFETGRLEEARAPFEAALALDPENLIALRHLGDIARLGGDHETARGWYTRVLEFDRRNDEVVALLAEVGGGAEQPAAPAPSFAPNIVSVASSVSVAASEPPRVVPDVEAPTPRPSIAPPVPVLGQASATPVHPPVDSSAKTIEVSAQPKPAKRGSLFDIKYDFGESGEASPALQAATEALDSIVAEAPSAPPPLSPPAAPEPIRPALFDAPIGRIIDSPAEAAPLAEMGEMDGFELAEFGADVSPLSELEPTEFVGGDADALDGLESMEYLVPSPETRASIASIAMDHMSTDALVEVSSADLPLLPEFGLPDDELSAASATDGIPLLPALEDAETIKIDVDDLRRRFETPATFVTETMAELYVQQGLHDKAIDVYRQLIAQSPNDQGLQDRLFSLEQLAEHPGDGVVEPEAYTAPVEEFAIEPIASVPEEFPEFEIEPVEAAAPAPRTTAPRVTLDFDTPVMSEAAVEPPAPANAMLSEMSFADVSLTTPRDPRRSTPVPVGPSAREFFSAFARRALTPLSMMVVSAVPSAAGGPLSPLDEIFGLSVDPQDESSAHRLAAIGATSGPSGGSALDSLFGEGPSAPMPAESPSATPPRGSVPRASAKLRFDQFFASSVASATPSSTESVPVIETASTPDPEPEPPSAAAPDAPGDDDLDQFQGWLRRLTQ